MTGNNWLISYTCTLPSSHLHVVFVYTALINQERILNPEPYRCSSCYPATLMLMLYGIWILLSSYIEVNIKQKRDQIKCQCKVLVLTVLDIFVRQVRILKSYYISLGNIIPLQGLIRIKKCPVLLCLGLRYDCVGFLFPHSFFLADFFPHSW